MYFLTEKTVGQIEHLKHNSSTSQVHENDRQLKTHLASVHVNIWEISTNYNSCLDAERLWTYFPLYYMGICGVIGTKINQRDNTLKWLELVEYHRSPT